MCDIDSEKIFPGDSSESAFIDLTLHGQLAANLRKKICLRYNIFATTKQRQNSDYLYGSYLETIDNDYSRNKYSKFISHHTWIDGNFHLSKALKININFPNIKNMDYRDIQIKAYIDQDEFLTNNRTTSASAGIYPITFIKLLYIDAFYQNRDFNIGEENHLVNISGEFDENQKTLDFDFYVVKIGRKTTNKCCFLHIDVKINNKIINIGNYHIITHAHKYSSGASVKTFVSSMPPRIKEGAIIC